MKPCANAGRPCPREAVLTARIAQVGDRPLCQQCFVGLKGLMGEGIRALETNAFVPEWRTRGLSRDFTGRVLA